MPYSFHAEVNPSDERCAEIAALSPTNPFYTPAFVASQAASGTQPWVLSLRNGEHCETGCTAFMIEGRLNRNFDLHSLPRLPDGKEFWNGLLALCRENRVSELMVNSFASEAAVVPTLGTELWRRPRQEYLLPLNSESPTPRLASNHKRNIKRGVQSGLRIRTSSTFTACREHARLVAASLDRRAERGETVSERKQAENFLCLTESSAGLIYQSVLDESVLSSVLVLMATDGAYYHSAGTLPEGMKIGASHFLINRIAQTLKEAGYSQLNLGGADQEGLARFKAGFGATNIKLEAARFFVGNKLKMYFMGSVRHARKLSARLPRNT